MRPRIAFGKHLNKNAFNANGAFAVAAWGVDSAKAAVLSAPTAIHVVSSWGQDDAPGYPQLVGTRKDDSRVPAVSVPFIATNYGRGGGVVGRGLGIGEGLTTSGVGVEVAVAVAVVVAVAVGVNVAVAVGVGV